MSPISLPTTLPPATCVLSLLGLGPSADYTPTDMVGIRPDGSANMVFRVLAGATLAFAGAVWIWEDFLGPWLYGPDPDLTPPRPRIAAIEPRRWRLDNDN
jgi:hypothetical protein